MSALMLLCIESVLSLQRDNTLSAEHILSIYSLRTSTKDFLWFTDLVLVIISLTFVW